MSYNFEISPELRKIFDKLARKDSALASAVSKKISQIVNSTEFTIEHFKNLRHGMSHLKRAQVGSFVLTFKLKSNIIIFEDFDHHDRIYAKYR